MNDTELRQRIVATLDALTRAVGGRSFADDVVSTLARRATYAITGASASSIFRDELAGKLRITKEFKSLHEYFMGNPFLLDVISGINPIKENFNKQYMSAFSTYVEVTLTRVLLLIRYRRTTEPESDLVDEFVSFLTPEKVHRKISIPISHVSVKEPEMDLGRCGKLFSTRLQMNSDLPYHEVYETAGVPTCKFVFEIDTGKFISAWRTEISDYLRLRIALIRLVVQPLASFNHFSISHIEPWEEPLDDTSFFERFWAKRRPVSQSEIPEVYISQEQARKISTLFDVCDEFDWSSGSSWRLAINRLDDAVYKLECGSTDSLLDIVIGLESVMVEDNSTQESTHKVANRTARFLNEDLTSTLRKSTSSTASARRSHMVRPFYLIGAG